MSNRRTSTGLFSHSGQSRCDFSVMILYQEFVVYSKPILLHKYHTGTPRHRPGSIRIAWQFVFDLLRPSVGISPAIDDIGNTFYRPRGSSFHLECVGSCVVFGRHGRFRRPTSELPIDLQPTGLKRRLSSSFFRINSFVSLW